MFGWLKSIKNAAEGAKTGTMAVDLWKQSFSEIAAREGAAQHDDFRFWFKTKDQFILKLKNHPALQTMRADVTYEERCVYYLVILQNEILRRTPRLFSHSELDALVSSSPSLSFAVLKKRLLSIPRGRPSSMIFCLGSWLTVPGFHPTNLMPCFIELQANIGCPGQYKMHAAATKIEAGQKL